MELGTTDEGFTCVESLAVFASLSYPVAFEIMIVEVNITDGTCVGSGSTDNLKLAVEAPAVLGKTPPFVAVESTGVTEAINAEVTPDPVSRGKVDECAISGADSLLKSDGKTVVGRTGFMGCVAICM